MVSVLDSVKLLHEDWEQVNAQFPHGKLLVRNVPGTGGQGAAALALAIIADNRLNLSFATISIRVAVTKIRALVEKSGGVAGLSGAASGSDRNPGAPPSSESMGARASWSSPHMGGTGSLGATPPPRGVEIATSGLSWSGLGSSSSPGNSGVSVTDAASSHFLTICTRVLAQSVGPLANVIVKESVRRVFPDRPFSKEQGDLLLSELEHAIRNPTDARQFRQAVRKAL